VRGDGTAGGYRWGTARKDALLQTEEAEQPHAEQ
jgi:O6-methylguanine-DNA--protein-cysteine methyltransferase